MRVARTLRIDRALSETEKATAAEQCREAGASCLAFLSNERFECTYATFETPRDGVADAICAQLASAAFWDLPVIALAIEPFVSDALPFLEEALGGAGKPAGVLRCERRAGSVLVELAEKRTSLDVILALVDVELRRFGNAARRVHCLSPLPVQFQACIAARGLAVPGIDSSQILEVLIERSHA